MSYVNLALGTIKRLVGWGVALLLGWMVLLALAQLILRWTLSTGIPWADLQLRQMVLWIGLLGGVLAAADNRHIRIDIVEHYLSPKVKAVVKRFTSLIAAAGSFYLGYLSIGFIRSEREAGVMLNRALFGLSLGQWIVEIVIPVGFWLMTIYFLASALLRARPATNGSQH